jgi:hypothetical protein
MDYAGTTGSVGAWAAAFEEQRRREEAAAAQLLRDAAARAEAALAARGIATHSPTTGGGGTHGALTAANNNNSNTSGASNTGVAAGVANTSAQGGAPQRVHVQGHLLAGRGGASGVAESVVDFARRHAADLVVVGSRGLGAW